LSRRPVLMVFDHVRVRPDMTIPRIVHFCFGFSPDFGHKPWSLIHYVSVASALRHIKPDEAFIHFEYQPRGPWWDLTRSMVRPVQIRAPREVFGNPVTHPAHRADVARLEILLQQGDIYLDSDVLVHRSFDTICNGPAVLGQQGLTEPLRVANAVILAEPGSRFIRKWLDSYRSFRSRGHDIYWDEHSVTVPGILAKRYPDSVRILPHSAFYWPLWFADDLKAMFGSSVREIVGEDTFATHLWETHSWKFVENLTPG
jgi:hypothetical protein